jgi:flagellar basal-body rod protein FlgC
MANEKLRLDVTALNIANMHAAGATAAQVYRPQRVSPDRSAASFRHAVRPACMGRCRRSRSVRGAAAGVAPRMVYEPGHPYADAKGMVAYPAVNHTAEMVNLNSALRAYEANVTAMNAAKTMAARTLDIGGQQ